MLKNKAMKKYKQRSEFRRSFNSSFKNKENLHTELNNHHKLACSRDFKGSYLSTKLPPTEIRYSANELEGSETPFQSENQQDRVEHKYAKTMDFLHKRKSKDQHKVQEILE